MASTPYIMLNIVFTSLAAHRDQIEQHLVAVGFEFLDRLPAGFVEDALDDLLLELGGELGIAQPWPAGSHARHQRVHEVLDAALAATQVPQQVWSHDAPA